MGTIVNTIQMMVVTEHLQTIAERKAEIMKSMFLLLIMIIANFQLASLYRSEIKRFEKTNDDKDLSSAKRWFISLACEIMLTFVTTVIIVIYQINALLSY